MAKNFNIYLISYRHSFLLPFMCSPTYFKRETIFPFPGEEYHILSECHINTLEAFVYSNHSHLLISEAALKTLNP